MSGSVPFSSPSRPGYQRQVAVEVNPVLQGYVWPRYDAAPDGSLSLSYFDTVKLKPGWYNGTAWKYAAEQDASGNMVISGTLAAGNTTITGTLSVSGTSTLAAVNSGNHAVTGTLSASGTSTLGVVNSGNHAITGTLSVSGTSTQAAINASGQVSAAGGAVVASTTRLDSTVPVRLPSYTVAGLPSAATHVRSIVYVSDGTTDHRLAISDGTNWRWPDGVIVS